LIEGTPILDIKPYIPAYDSFPDSRAGWVDEIDEMEEKIVPYEISIEKLAEEQLLFLRENWEIDFMQRTKEILSKDPRPHRTRRIHKLSKSINEYVIHSGPWRIIFEIIDKEHKLLIKRLGPNFPRKSLERYSNPNMNRPDFEAQLDFLNHYPDSEITRIPT
jgi:mRNA-degrading endonuclease RelE of RelBE toxin-antitoxin system